MRIAQPPQDCACLVLVQQPRECQLFTIQVTWEHAVQAESRVFEVGGGLVQLRDWLVLQNLDRPSKAAAACIGEQVRSQ